MVIKKSNTPSNKLSLPVERTQLNEEKLRRYFEKNGADQFEGIYESVIATSTMPKYKVGVVKNDNGYDIIYLDGSTNNLDWIEGDLKAKLISTATLGLFKADWRMKNKHRNKDAYVTFEEGALNSIINEEKTTFIKLFPSVTENFSSIPASGTGFGISSSGLIVTNSHVVSGAFKVKIRGINGDFNKSFSAKIILEDKNNDLALLQIDDPSFTSLGSIPFTTASKLSDVGTSVFVLGYPLKAVMGDEIKLTNGIISSKSGFRGDVTSYQISVPIQPGNSGGPLFDSNGNLIGIVNAKLSIGENVSYAVKVNYLKSLIEQLSQQTKLSTTNLLNGKSLPEQVKLVRKYVYIVEVN